MDWFTFFVLLAACSAAATTGAMFSPGAWYEALDKPPWTPPKWLFPVAWTTLYLLMSAAGALVVDLPGASNVLALWALQIALNTLWTPIFFGLRHMRAGFIVITFLWAAVAATMVGMFQLDTLAGFLFAPYLLWVTVAAALNFSVWRRNPDVKPLSAL